MNPATSMQKRVITLNVNGLDREVMVEPRTLLIEALREGLGLTGTKHGCGEGDCGACTVLVDGVPINSCLVLAAEAVGSQILTIEGVAKGNDLHPLQQAFVDKGAIQCGFCTPAMVLTSLAFLKENPDPTEDDVRRAISGNLCRCTGYQKIVEAVLDAAERMRGDS